MKGINGNDELWMRSPYALFSLWNLQFLLYRQSDIRMY